jgi:hypothetical protein
VTTATKNSRGTAKKAAPRTKKAAPRTAKPKSGEEPMERVSRSIDAAEAALKDLGTGADKGTRDLIHDLEKALDHARGNARRVARAVKKDLKRA